MVFPNKPLIELAIPADLPLLSMAAIDIEEIIISVNFVNIGHVI